jgi:phosphoglycerol transferase MdoB-like AlkP superfamily enzyme
MSPAYGYDTTICYCDIDTILFRKLDSLVDEGWRYIQCITQSTHAPFVNEQYSHLALPKSMPWVMYNFIRGFNALDDGLGYLVRKIETDPVLQNYTIVITGDHRILHYEKRRQMQRYARHWADKVAGTELAWIASLTPEDDCLPLIIYSPKISGNPHYTGDCYQMDIYPTYRTLVGADKYSWKGFGINLMDSTQKRPIDEDEAFQLSDRLIRNNYFQR